MALEDGSPLKASTGSTSPERWVPSGACAPRALHPLEVFLGYSFAQPQLLQQACTHNDDRAELSYSQLAFVGAFPGQGCGLGSRD